VVRLTRFKSLSLRGLSRRHGGQGKADIPRARGDRMSEAEKRREEKRREEKRREEKRREFLSF
jgi:hypothetical protein